MAKVKHALTLEWADFDVEPTDGVVDQPTLDDVESIVRHLGLCSTGFVILRRDDLTYIQTTFRELDDPDEGLIVEWQDGGTDRHFELDEPYVSVDRAEALFRRFFQEPESVASGGPWKPMRV